ncbi:helicase associated domain-containing protein [Streptomyces nigrescens]|uniref:helicase associated domain-containing protein n=1 Tax=Streptomyces nigrescens TaxID=1920 RepID=UPI0015827CD9
MDRARRPPAGTARHGEQVAVGGETEPVFVKLGVWVSKRMGLPHQGRRHKLTSEQRAALRELGIEWA